MIKRVNELVRELAQRRTYCMEARHVSECCSNLDNSCQNYQDSRKDHFVREMILKNVYLHTQTLT